MSWNSIGKLFVVTSFGESHGPAIGCVIDGCPPGHIAHALMDINAVKGIEIGDGFACVEQRGGEHRDEMTPQGFLSNHAGGTLGGISSGQDVLRRSGPGGR